MALIPSVAPVSDAHINTLADTQIDARYATRRTLVGNASGDPVAVPTVFNVMAYGATGDGVSDDTAEVQATIDAAGAAGGGDIYLPEGYTFLCNTVTDAANDYILSLNSSHLHFTGGGTLKTTASGAALFAFNTDKTEIARTTTGLKTMTTAAKGASSITLATPGDAAAFAAGDWCFVRTGQALELSGNNQPDSELNKVISANAGTGVLVLQWPLAKPYAQEKIDTGGGFTYVSKVGGAGSNVPFGVINAGANITEDISFRGVRFHARSGVPLMIGGNCYGVTIENCDFDLDESVWSMGVLRSVKAVKNRVRITAATTDDYLFSPNTGSTDHLYADNECASTAVAQFHIHEGSAQIRVNRNTVLNTYDAAHDINAVSIRSRAYDVEIIDNTFVNAGSGDVILVGTYCDGGGVIAGNRISGSTPSSISVNAANWRVQHNSPGAGSTALYSQLTYGVTERLAGRIKYNSTSPVTLGSIPMPTCVLKVHMNVLTAFNAGNTRIRVGISGAEDIYAGYTDVGSTGIKTATAGSWLLGQTFGNNSGLHTVVVQIDSVGASAGEVIVIVEYVLLPATTVS